MSVALVTGGGRGIGLAVAASLLRSGFDVAIASLEAESEVAKSLELLGKTGRRVCYRSVDLSRLDCCEPLVTAIQTELGPIDCLVNNAGVTSLYRGDLLDLSAESFDRCLGINLRATFFLTQTVARSMLARPSADASTYRSIITITSANADIVGVNRADYCMSKAALSMASKLFAARLAEARIHVFEVRPGIIRTDMTAPAVEAYDRFIGNGGVPLGRWGVAEDVGNAVATIAGGGLPYSTGEVINVGGGLHLHRV